MTFAKAKTSPSQLKKKDPHGGTKSMPSKLERTKHFPEYIFYDGPPFATGLPHYGHILAGTIKDIVTRYQSMTGHHVTRRFGWDCHGLPVEHEIDQKLGIKSREDVIKMGIANYNEECRGIVQRYVSEWEKTVVRMGRWIDFRNDYKTMDLNFMESVWWVFAQLFQKGLVYRGFKVMPYSTVRNKFNGKVYVVAESRLGELPVEKAKKALPDGAIGGSENSNSKPKASGGKAKNVETYEILDKYTGASLVGKKYVPLFDYFKDYADVAFRVVADDYVTDDSGTGVVHCAPAFGEDDYRRIVEFSGRYVKDADKDIIQAVKEKGRLVKSGSFTHNYPFCWRSDTPLIYRAVPSWFVAVEKIKDQLLENNKQTYWVPDFVKEKRFHNWLENARDWAVSRSRFWGTPLPLWISEDGEEIVVMDSIEKLEKLSGAKVTDLHRHKIDHITIPSSRGPEFGVLRRVEDVFDCWFESGSMPYAYIHYPFENVELFENNFPGHFVAEGSIKLVVPCAKCKKLEVEGLAPFKPIDQHILQKSSNVLDQWINSATQSLVHFVRQEMDALDSCKSMAPFTPFFTEVLYHNLRKVSNGSEESIHYCSFPAVEGKRGERIEESVNRMMTIIDLAQPDFSVLGKRLGKSMGVVAKAVKAMSTEDILAFEKAGEITIASHVLKLSDIKITREFKPPSNVKAEDMDAKGDGDVLVVLDLRRDESLYEAGVAREIVNRIQKLRKKAALEPTDLVEVFIKSLDEDKANLQEILESQELYIRDALGSLLLPSALLPPHAVVLAEESFHGISNLSFAITLTRPALVFKSDAIVSLYAGNTKSAHGLQTYLLTRDHHNLKAEFQLGKGKIKINCIEDLPPVDVALGEHVFLTVGDYFSSSKGSI
ncbi:UNVERIFIED_CONTAM: Isoleucine--tRNA ligase, cytoplasmic [Sesamum radiatum]|uniref:isoleucine--tRNA ligase n=1 Tax=Sesamum radiatum TaxID=300843 RepID=A0AAW2W127_SESRA